MQDILFTCLYNLMASAITKVSGLFSNLWRPDFTSEVNEVKRVMLTKYE